MGMTMDLYAEVHTSVGWQRCLQADAFHTDVAVVREFLFGVGSKFDIPECFPDRGIPGDSAWLDVYDERHHFASWCLFSELAAIDWASPENSISPYRSESILTTTDFGPLYQVLELLAGRFGANNVRLVAIFGH